MDKSEIEKGFYSPFMNKEEIDGIFDVQTGEDFLLKLRADVVVDNMRLFRVYRNRALIKKGEWTNYEYKLWPNNYYK